VAEGATYLVTHYVPKSAMEQEQRVRTRQLLDASVLGAESLNLSPNSKTTTQSLHAAYTFPQDHPPHPSPALPAL
jgi:hypothetical protein